MPVDDGGLHSSLEFSGIIGREMHGCQQAHCENHIQVGSCLHSFIRLKRDRLACVDHSASAALAA